MPRGMVGKEQHSAWGAAELLWFARPQASTAECREQSLGSARVGRSSREPLQGTTGVWASFIPQLSFHRAQTCESLSPLSQEGWPENEFLKLTDSPQRLPVPPDVPGPSDSCGTARHGHGTAVQQRQTAPHLLQGSKERGTIPSALPAAVRFPMPLAGEAGRVRGGVRISCAFPQGAPEAPAVAGSSLP